MNFKKIWSDFALAALALILMIGAFYLVVVRPREAAEKSSQVQYIDQEDIAIDDEKKINGENTESVITEENMSGNEDEQKASSSGSAAEAAKSETAEPVMENKEEEQAGLADNNNETVNNPDEEPNAGQENAMDIDIPVKTSGDEISDEGVFKTAYTTVFWAGESADESNSYISNAASYWDENWLESYGGVDSPDNRCGYQPCGFTPRENPFYFALPYGELDRNGRLKSSARIIPWYNDTPDKEFLLKNRWIEIRFGGSSCYAQWEDVGPFEDDDFDYVFGESEPANTEGVGAGLDLSPAAWDCLGLKDNGHVEWRFVDEAAVPPGSWTETITRSGASY